LAVLFKLQILTGLNLFLFPKIPDKFLKKWNLPPLALSSFILPLHEIIIPLYSSSLILLPWIRNFLDVNSVVGLLNSVWCCWCFGGMCGFYLQVCRRRQHVSLRYWQHCSHITV
jgi:hypothetical protein